MDYLRHWSLRRKPFLFSASDDFFAAAPQREALAGINYLIGSSAQLALLSCQRSNGLTWLLSHAANMRGFGDHAVELVRTECPFADRRRILGCFADRLGFEVSDDKVEQRISGTIEHLGDRGMELIWLLDRCHVEVARLASALCDRHPNLSLVLGIADDQIRRTETALGRSGIQIELAPLSLDDTFQYAAYCIRRAGGDSAIFSDQALVRLHELSGGVIGVIAPHAELAVALAARQRLDRILPGTVEQAARRCVRAA